MKKLWLIPFIILSFCGSVFGSTSLYVDTYTDTTGVDLDAHTPDYRAAGISLPVSTTASNDIEINSNAAAEATQHHYPSYRQQLGFSTGQYPIGISASLATISGNTRSLYVITSGSVYQGAGNSTTATGFYYHIENSDGIGYMCGGEVSNGTFTELTRTAFGPISNNTLYKTLFIGGSNTRTAWVTNVSGGGPTLCAWSLTNTFNASGTEIMFQNENGANGYIDALSIERGDAYEGTPTPTFTVTHTPTISPTPTITPTRQITSTRTATPTATPTPIAFYVSTTGDDDNPGTLAEPWKTIQKAADTLEAGQGVYIRAGTYNEHVIISNSGTYANWITYQAYGDEEVIIDGDGIALNTYTGLLTVSGDYIYIKGIKVQHAYTTSTSSRHSVLAVNADYFTMADCEVSSHTAAAAVRFDTCTYVKFLNNKVFDCNTGAQEGIRCESKKVLIQDNEIYNIWNIGIDILGNASTWSNTVVVKNNYVHDCTPFATAAGVNGLYVDGGRGTLMTGNTVTACERGIQIAAEIAGTTTGANNSPIIVRKNLLYENKISALTVGGSAVNQGRVENTRINNNTCVENAANTFTGSSQWSNVLKVGFLSGLVKLLNNIFIQSNMNNVHGLAVQNTQTDDPDDIITNYNVWYPNASKSAWGVSIYNDFPGYQAGIGQEANSFSNDPLLGNSTTANFWLQSSSPCLDKGSPLTYATAASSNSVIAVSDAKWFWGALPGFWPGDQVMVGSQGPAEVLRVDYANNTLELSENLNVLENEPVTLIYHFSAPDIGAYETEPTNTPTPSATSTPNWTATPTTTPIILIPTLTPDLTDVNIGLSNSRGLKNNKSRGF